MNHRYHLISSIALLLITTTLGGCLSGGSVSPPVHYYTLNVSEPRMTVTPAQITVGVGPFQFPDYLDRPQIVTRRGSNSIELAEFDRWAEPLKSLFERSLVSSLDEQLPTHAVIIFPFGTRLMDVRYRLIGRVMQFDTNETGQAVLDVRWVLTTPQEDQIGPSMHSRHTARIDPSAGYPAIVDAMSRVVVDFSQELASILLTRIGQ